jgi:hypothetical protein
VSIILFIFALSIINQPLKTNQSWQQEAESQLKIQTRQYQVFTATVTAIQKE